MAQKRERYLLTLNSAAVIRNAHERCAALLDLDRDGGCPGIDRVLDKLLDHRGRPFHHLPGCYFIDCFLRKQCYLRHSIPPICLCQRRFRLPAVLYLVLKFV